MALDVEPDDAAAEEPSRISSRKGQIPNRSALGQGMCQKLRIVARGRRARMSFGASAK